MCWLIHCCNHDDDNSDKSIDNDKYYDKNINKCDNDDTKCTNSTMVTYCCTYNSTLHKVQSLSDRIQQRYFLGKCTGENQYQKYMYVLISFTPIMGPLPVDEDVSIYRLSLLFR